MPIAVFPTNFAMSTIRLNPVSVLLDSNTWMVIGGGDDFENELETTEFFDLGTNTFSPGPDVPFASKVGCAVRTEGGKYDVFVYGGFWTCLLYTSPSPRDS